MKKIKNKIEFLIIKYLWEKTFIFEKVLIKYFGKNYDDTEFYDELCNSMEHFLY